jgi:hypothetical protein
MFKRFEGVCMERREGKISTASCIPSDKNKVSREDNLEDQRRVVENLRVQWKLLWKERFDDKIRAEGVSVSEYPSLRVEQGSIIHATRDFKALNFREIVEENLGENPDRFVQPNVNVGGWNKFIKTQIAHPNQQRKRRAETYVAQKTEVQQQSKKGGRGWLHVR